MIHSWTGDAATTGEARRLCSSVKYRRRERFYHGEQDQSHIRMAFRICEARRSTVLPTRQRERLALTWEPCAAMSMAFLGAAFRHSVHVKIAAGNLSREPDPYRKIQGGHT
jgi:hypothetical protein